MLLDVNNLWVSLGGLQILQGVDFHVNEGELVVIVGANGAGKSTLLRSISGLAKSQEGKVTFQKEDLTNKLPNEIAQKGMTMVPEGRQLFPELTAKENLLVAAHTYRKDKKEVEKNLNMVYEMFPVIKKNENRIASSFSGGEQQMITIGRGLMRRPKLMMIDELSLGLAPKIIAELFQVIKQLNEKKMSILLIEQNARQALAIADRAYVLENGRISMSGTGKELLNDPRVQEAYLGL